MLKDVAENLSAVATSEQKRDRERNVSGRQSIWSRSAWENESCGGRDEREKRVQQTRDLPLAKTTPGN